MRIKSRYFIGSAIITLGLLFTGCSEDDDPPMPDDPTFDVTKDLTLGYNSIIMDIDNLTTIPLHNDADVILVSDNPNVEFYVEKYGDRQVIIPVFKQPIENLKEPFVTKLEIKVNNHESKLSDKVIYVSFRRSTDSGSIDPDVNYARAIGKGTKPWGDIGNVTYPVLSFEVIYPNLSLNENLTSASLFFEVSGERYSQSVEAMSFSLGLSGSVPVKGVNLSGSAAFGYNEQSTSVNIFEYYMGYYGKCMSEVKLNLDWIINEAEKDCCFAYLDETVNDVLNNPGSQVYKNYPNTQEGIYKLLDTYGTHIITKGVFGGNYITLYGREENAYTTTVGMDASVAISASQQFSDNSKNWAQVYVEKTRSKAISASGDGSKYTEEYNSASKGFNIITAKGGNASVDMELWDNSITSETRDSWIPISYITKDANSESDNGLVPITYFITDSLRSVTVNKYIDEYYKAHCKELTENPMIVADFMMVAGDNGHKAGDPQPIVQNDGFGIPRIYYPMMANNNAPVDEGYAIETSQRAYVVASDMSDHYWYYALGHRDETNKFYGILDVKFNDEDIAGYTRRGDNADTDITGALHKNYVYLKFAGATDTNPITGIGLRSVDDGKIIASTGGTEMAYPWGTDDARFNTYWSSTDNYTIGDGEWLEGGGLIENCDFTPAYTTIALDNIFNYGNGNTIGKISHPTEW